MATALFFPRMAASGGIESVIDSLSAARNYHSGATVTVQLPQGGDDIVYNLELWSTPSVNGDTLNVCNYLIDWNLTTDNGTSKGFTAYHDGNFYRNNDERLQENHFRWDSIPFLMRHPVQSSSQFTDMLPQMLARELQTVASDSTWSYTFSPDTLYRGKSSAVIKARQRIHGINARNVLYVLDPLTFMPVQIERENNPGSISEQMLIIRFTGTDKAEPQGMTEDALIARYPTVFEKFRESNFSLESMRGKYLPGFSLPTLSNHRYSRGRTDRFQVPVVVAFIDPSVATASQTISEIRKAQQMMPRSIDVIFAFIGSDREGVRELTGQSAAGEQVLMSAQSLARDCGVTSTPSFIIVGEDGIVKDIIIGFNKALSTVVIEKTSVL
ncbi:MAG: hypothetical protein K2M07_04305 [Muribaculaceae bacterium]|nr:hypothetical protein [Muribaculaceae bacterium]